MGGLLRRSTFLERLRMQQDPVLYLDLGNNFPEPSEQGSLKVRLIHEALRRMKPAAIMPGPNEWLHGLEALDPELPYLLSNQSGALPFLEQLLVKKGNKRIAVRGYLSPQLVYQNPNDGPLVLPVSEDLLGAWKKSLDKTGADFRVLLFRGNLEEMDSFQNAGLFDMIVMGSNNDDELHQKTMVKTAFGVLPMIPTKGQGVLAGNWNEGTRLLVPHGEEILSSGLGVTWLRGDIPDDEGLKPEFADYDRSVKALFFSNLDRMEKQREESPFVGDTGCSACHIQAAEVWEKTGHGHAFETLKRKGKHFDPECLECHVVGLKPWRPPFNASAQMSKWEGLRGFLSPELTPHLKNVQCENCHGPARGHIADQRVKTPVSLPAEICSDCHHGSHSPLFDFNTYWPKIEHK